MSSILTTVAVSLTPEEHRYILNAVGQRIRFNTIPLPSPSLWHEWLAPIALSSALFGTSIALLVQHYYGWIHGVTALYLLSVPTDARFASGIVLTWGLGFLIATWTVVTLLRLQFPQEVSRKPQSENISGGEPH